MVHRLLRELLECAPSSVVADFVDTLSQTGGSFLKMVHTHDGAAAACMALAYGTPKDRKKLVKGMKGYVWQMAENEWGNAVVCTALAVVDDTALTVKSIGADIKVCWVPREEGMVYAIMLMVLLLLVYFFKGWACQDVGGQCLCCIANSARLGGVSTVGKIALRLSIGRECTILLLLSIARGCLCCCPRMTKMSTGGQKMSC